MRLAANGQTVDETEQKKTLLQRKQYGSAALPFGQRLALKDISGPTYLTAQTLIQQVAFTLSDNIFSYSPDTFDLDIAATQWAKEQQQNAWGSRTTVQSFQTRSGAGRVALGYIFSPDFDLEKRHIPQSILATSAGLHQMRAQLDELSLLYSHANPTVAHVAAIDYAASGFVTDYVSPMSIADDLGFALVSSTSSYEVQHMSLFATLLATQLPTLHVYDGINVGRETTQIVDVQDQQGLQNAYDAITKDTTTSIVRRSDNEAKTLSLLNAFNNELGTDYKLFEYYGHAEPESVLVVFGTVEGSLAAQLAFALGNNNTKVAAINVRVYRPFVESEFLAMLPKSVRHISVLGQVHSYAAVTDAAEHSKLYFDVLAAVSFSAKFEQAPVVLDVKYAREEVWTPAKMLSIMKDPKNASQAVLHDADNATLDILGPSVKKYIFWDVDDSAAVDAPTAIAQLLSRSPTENITLRSNYDNMVRGGIIRTDLRSSPKSIEAPYPINAATVAYVREENILKDFDILASLANEGIVLLRLPDAKGQDLEKLEKRLPAAFRRGLREKNARLYALDPSASGTFTQHAELEGLLSQLAFLRIARDDLHGKLEKFAAMYGDAESVRKLYEELDNAVWQVEIPEAWATAEAEAAPRATRININSFRAFNKTEETQPGFLKSWITAAKGLAFKEATGTRTKLRPDASVKTATVHVKEHRRLTPESYDRNVFHIEFDLGNSGVTYAIGEALGIHAENDAQEVNEFIAWYGLTADDIVEVPAREDPALLENRTVYQSLLQNVDIFGRPPKRFYEELAEFATDEEQRKSLLALGGPEGAVEFQRRSEVDTCTYADVLAEFPSAHPALHDLVRIVAPMKRREYSIASSQKVTPTSVSLLIVTVNWTDSKGRDRFGQATRYLNSLPVGAPVTVSVKASVMKLPASPTAPLIMAGLGTGLAPFRAFVQERAYQRDVLGQPIGKVLLYMGSRHQREEYLYGEEWEAYRDSGVVTLLGCAFSRDQPEKIYIQDRMRESLAAIRDAYLQNEGAFYLCGPTWPVPDVTAVLQEAVEAEHKAGPNASKKVDSRRAIDELKEAGRYVLEVY